jgi:protein-disulfide isomerase
VRQFVIHDKGVVMIRFPSALGLLTLFLLIRPCGVAYAAPAGTEQDISRQMTEIQKQLREVRDEMGKLSGRLEKLEALVRMPKQPQKVNVRLDNAPRLGDSGAKLGIVEFSDYQCPYCRRFYLQTFPQLQKSYIDAGKVALIIRDFPLDFHPQAMGASLALHCVGKQDAKKFWDVQGDLFAHQDRLGNPFYRELVKKYGLDQQKFDTCVGDAAQKKQIEDNLQYAQTLGVEGTPTFFIGRIEGNQLVDATPLVGAQPYPVFVRIIDSLSKQQDKGT